MYKYSIHTYVKSRNLTLYTYTLVFLNILQCSIKISMKFKINKMDNNEMVPSDLDIIR